MFKELFLGLLIACSCNIGNTMEEGIFSQDTGTFYNSAKLIVYSCNAVEQPLLSEDNQFLFNTYSDDPYIFHGGLFTHKSS